MHKPIVVTGADGDIGFAIVKRLVQENYPVVAIIHGNPDKSPLMELQKNSSAVIDIFQVDLSVPSEIKSVFLSIGEKYPTVFGLVNNAGVYPIIYMDEYDLPLWEHVIGINLTAPFLCVKYSVHLMKQHGGKIINISSTGAHLGSRDPGYSASKAGLIGLTKSLARGLSKYTILVNAIAPGTIDTKMSRRMKPEDRGKNVQMSLVKRLGTPEDVAGGVMFLLSKDADYITGFTLDINGGLYIR